MRPDNLTFKNLKYEKWIRKNPCLVCGSQETQAHHVWSTGSKNGRNSMTAVPLCFRHHIAGNPDAYHQLEKREFENRHSIVLEYSIINLLSQYIEQITTEKENRK